MSWGMGLGQRTKSKIQRDARDNAGHFWNKKGKKGKNKSNYWFSAQNSQNFDFL